MNEPIPLKYFKTIKQAGLEINPPKKECKSKKCCKNTKSDLENITSLHSEVASGIIRRVERYVKEYSDDMLLGEAVRELFS